MNQLPISEPIFGYIARQFLFDMQEGFGQWDSAEVIGICSYKDERPTLKVLLGNGAIFDYLPFSAFTTSPPNDMPVLDLTPNLCPTHDCTWQTFPALKTREARVWLDKDAPPLAAKYIGTVDWPDANVSANLCLLLDKHQLAMVPNYRMLIGEGTKLPAYKKLRQVWK